MVDPEIDRLRRMIAELQEKQRWHEQILCNIEAIVLDIQRKTNQKPVAAPLT